MFKKFLSIFLILFCGIYTFAEGSRREIVSAALEFDALYGSNTCYAELEMEIIRPGVKKKFLMKFWARTSGKIFIKIISPSEDNNMATLVVDGNIWNYSASEGRVRKIKKENLGDAWLDSDLVYLGMIRKFSLTKEFLFEGYKPEKPEEGMEYVKCIPKQDKDKWGAMVLCYDKICSIPKWFKIFDKKGKLMRTMTYTNIKKLDGKQIPSLMKAVPADKPGYSTTIRYLKLKFNPDIPDKVFSLKNLRNSL